MRTLSRHLLGFARRWWSPLAVVATVVILAGALGAMVGAIVSDHDTASQTSGVVPGQTTSASDNVQAAPDGCIGIKSDFWFLNDVDLSAEFRANYALAKCDPIYNDGFGYDVHHYHADGSLPSIAIGVSLGQDAVAHWGLVEDKIHNANGSLVNGVEQDDDILLEGAYYASTGEYVLCIQCYQGGQAMLITVSYDDTTVVGSYPDAKPHLRTLTKRAANTVLARK
jgi:hypothetical protein